MIIIEACAEKPRSWSELKRLTGLSHTKISAHLKELVLKRCLIKRDDGLYYVTKEGLEAFEKFSRLCYADIAQPQLTPSDVEELIQPKLEAVEKETTSKIHKPSEKLKHEFLQILTRSLGLHSAEKDELAHFSEHLAKGLNVNVFPIPTPESRQSVTKAALKLLSELMKFESFRDKIAEHGKMTILLTLDLGDVKLPANIKSAALYYVFA